MPEVDRPPRALRLGLRVPLAVVAVALVAFLLGVGFGPLDPFMSRWAALILEAGGAAACALRAITVKEERRAWSLIAAGASSWVLGDLIWRVAYFNAAEPPSPSVADVFWLGFYPFVYCGVGLLIRERARHVSAEIWIDGLIAALAAGALATAVIYEEVLEQIGGPSQTTAINLSYVLADSVLLGLILVAFALSGWRFDRAWAWLGGALAVFALSDSIYVYEVAKGTYEGGGLLDAGWALGLLLIGVAAWHTGPPRRVTAREESWRSIALPIAFGVLALGLEIFDHFNQVTPLALALASACLAAVLGRLALTFGKYLQMLRAARAQASTDALTGLGNRRRLLDDLEFALDAATPESPRILLLLDLDGFKAYNDAYGHPAGDALLVRLSRRLSLQLEPWGRAYRLGGDEFCALLTPENTTAQALASLAAAAVREAADDGHDIEGSVGWALLPAEAESASDALRLADKRMYGKKGSPQGRPSRRARFARTAGHSSSTML